MDLEKTMKSSVCLKGKREMNQDGNKEGTQVVDVCVRVISACS